MGASGGFPVDLVLFGMIAVFLVLRLRSILGRRTGFERPVKPSADVAADAPGRLGAEGRIIDGHAETVSETAGRRLPEPASPAGKVLLAMRRLDRNFDPTRFLDGAEAAFRLIVEAFAAGNRDALRPLLSDDTFRAFDAVITAREAASETQHTEIHAIRGTEIEAAELHGSIGDVTVRFASDQVNVTLGRDGNPVQGAEAVTEIVDIWTFERDLAARDPTWRLLAARSA